MKLHEDPRWRRFNDKGFKCPCCSMSFNGVFDIVYNHPDPWQGPGEYEHNAAVPDALTRGRDVLTEDFCIMGPHRFMRAVLPMKIIGSDTVFAYGVWGSINPEHYQDVIDNFDNGEQAHLGPYFSWLMNKLPGANNSPARCSMEMSDNRQRPKLWIKDEDHPFFAAQHDGITFDQLLDIYAAAGQDIRPHLLDS